MLLNMLLLYAVVLPAVILIHELGHALVARRHGLTVDNIIVGIGPRWLSLRCRMLGLPVAFRPLMLAGGAYFDEAAFRAAPVRIQLAVIIAGPLASLAFGLPVWVAARFLLAGVLPPLLTAPLILLGGLSWLVGGVLNLAPIPPLDGGRLLLLGLRALGLCSRKLETVLTATGEGLIVLAQVGMIFGWRNAAALAAGVAFALAARAVRRRVVTNAKGDHHTA